MIYAALTLVTLEGSVIAVFYTSPLSSAIMPTNMYVVNSLPTPETFPTSFKQSQVMLLVSRLAIPL